MARSDTTKGKLHFKQMEVKRKARIIARYPCAKVEKVEPKLKTTKKTD